MTTRTAALTGRLATAFILACAMGSSTVAAAQGSPTASGGARPICADRPAPAFVTGAHHPGDGVPDPAGRIVFGRLERRDEFREPLVTLFAIDPDGSDLRILTHTAGFADTPDWSPDGSWLVFSHSPVGCASPTYDACTRQEGMHQTLWRMDVDGSNQRQIGNPNTYDWEPRLSPDGTEVVFTRVDVQHDDWFSPMIRDLATRVERPVTSNASEPEHPEWSRDGRSILFGIIHAPGNPDLPQERVERVPGR